MENMLFFSHWLVEKQSKLTYWADLQTEVDSEELSVISRAGNDWKVFKFSKNWQLINS